MNEIIFLVEESPKGGYTARAYGSLVGVEYGEAFVRSQAIPVCVERAESLCESAV